MTVGVMGSSGGIIPSEVAKKAYKLGNEIKVLLPIRVDAVMRKFYKRYSILFSLLK
jgi:hypothetical protein